MISNETKKMIPVIQEYFAAKPIKKAWLFGSCSRGEDRPDSDVDLLVVYDEEARVSLLTIGGIYMDLTKLLGREVDLVEEGTLLPFAVESAENDKILIYERAWKRHVLVHDYYRISPDKLWETVVNDIPVLKNLIENI